MRWVRYFRVSFILLFVLGGVLPGASVQAKKDYQSVLEKWTDEDEAYNWTEIEARLVWHATYLSPSFREAKVERYASLYELDAAEVARLKSEESQEAADYDVFIAAIYVGSRVYQDIGKDRSLWRLVLETPDGAQVEPIEWEEVPKNQVTRVLYPYVDRWAKVFKVKFPKRISDQTQEAKLRMIGVPADSELSWNLKELVRSS